MKAMIFLVLMAVVTVIPYGMQHYDVVATYLAPLKPFVFGAQVKDLPSDQQVGGTGVFLKAVQKDSPAFYDDISQGGHGE